MKFTFNEMLYPFSNSVQNTFCFLYAFLKEKLSINKKWTYLSLFRLLQELCQVFNKLLIFFYFLKNCFSYYKIEKYKFLFKSMKFLRKNPWKLSNLIVFTGYLLSCSILTYQPITHLIGISPILWLFIAALSKNFFI